MATPGRAVDHLDRGTLRFDEVQTVVLDEADEMLDMGFADDLDRILGALQKERQTALFSATIAGPIARLAERHLDDPVRVRVHETPQAKGEEARVRQVAYVVRRADKLAALGRILDLEDGAATLVFARTRGEVDDLAEALSGRGRDAAALHGGLSQEQRDRIMGRFRDGALDVLVATDVAARGLDIGHISHVVNYDVPSSTDVYVHRIGRTGRAGREGVAITLVEPREHRLLRDIERAVGQPLEIAGLPTISDVREHRMDALRAQLREALVAGDFDRYRAVVEPLSGEFDLVDIALAAISQADAEARGAEDTAELAQATLPSFDRPGARGPARRPFSQDRPGPRAPYNAPPPFPQQGYPQQGYPQPGTRSRASTRSSRAGTRASVRAHPAPASAPRPPSARTRGSPRARTRSSSSAPARIARTSRVPARAARAPPPALAAASASPAGTTRRAGPCLRAPNVGSGGGGITRLFIGAGRAAGMRPGDLVGAITNEAGLRGGDIGAIQIADGFSLVEVPEAAADHVIRALRAATIKGQKVMVRRERY